MKCPSFLVERAFLLAAALVGTLCAGCTSPPGPIGSVIVRGAEFGTVKTLSAAELPKFERLWRERDVVDMPFHQTTGAGHYKLDVGRDGSSGARWLYQTTGHLTALSAKRTPVYRLREPAAFNNLIGAAP